MGPHRRSFLKASLAAAGAGGVMAVVPAGAAASIAAPAPAARERTVLCFGDSNTWGFVPRLEQGETRFGRYDAATRWPRVLEVLMSPGVRVVEHGICGLVGAMKSGAARFEDGQSRAAIDHVQGLLSANWPVDELVVMLGTNDLAWPELAQAGPIAGGIVTTIRQGLASHDWLGGPAPAVTLVSPIPLGPAARALGVAEEGLTRSRALAPALAAAAKEAGWAFLDAAAAGELDTEDGVHWSAAHHQRFARMLAEALTSPADRRLPVAPHP